MLACWRSSFPTICTQCQYVQVQHFSNNRTTKKKWKTRPPKIYTMKMDKERLHQEGKSWDKMLGNKEVQFLSYIANHPEKIKPIVMTDRVHNVGDVLPGVEIGPKFFDHEAGDTTTEGLEEATSINNFLHLAPPMIKHHTDELKKLITPTPPKPVSGIRQYTTNYLYAGPSIKHPLAREASIRVDIKDLEMEPDTEEYFREMVTSNQNLKLKDIKLYDHFRLPKIFRDLPVLLELQGDVLTIHAKQCPTRKQNLSLCYYRLSGFMQEAAALKPVYEDFDMPLFCMLYAFDHQDMEGSLLRFEGKNFVKLHRDEEGNCTGMTGSAESVALAKKLLLDASSGIVTEEFLIPAPFTRYVKEKCAAFTEILDANEVLYHNDNLITFSDAIENVKDEVGALLEDLSHFTVPCPSNLAQFILTEEFLAYTTKGYSPLLEVEEDCFAVTIQSQYIDSFKSLLLEQIEDTRDAVKMEEVACSEDVDWEKLAVQFNAHVAPTSADKVTITADPDILKEISYFLKLKKEFRASLAANMTTSDDTSDDNT